MSDRIKLAEAMGWERATSRDSHGSEWSVWQKPGTEEFYSVANIAQFPDPFTDANDDYAVLEWMREKYKGAMGDEYREEQRFRDYFRLDWAPYWQRPFDYQIGDYARAALKVIGNKQTDPEQ